MGEKQLNKLHSLSIFTNTPEEYKKIDNDESVLGNKVPPLCASKNKNDKI